MNSQYVLGIIISVLLSVNGITLTLFIANIRDLKKVIQELSLAIKGSQKDIEFLNKTLEIHEKMLEKHSEEIVNLKTKE